jgi:hypothetical protein
LGITEITFYSRHGLETVGWQKPHDIFGGPYGGIDIPPVVTPGLVYNIVNGTPYPFQGSFSQRTVGPGHKPAEGGVVFPVTAEQGGAELVVRITGYQAGLEEPKGILGLTCRAEIIVTFNVRIMIRQKIGIFSPEQFILDIREVHLLIILPL